MAHELSEPPQWLNSPLPFFVLVRDHSKYVLPGSVEPEPEPQSSRDIHSQSSSEVVERERIEHGGEFLTSQIYPDVRYVFEDDDFDPAVDALEHEEGDISVIVDFDATGEKIVSYKSLSPTWQITEAACDGSTTSAPAWVRGQPNSSSRKLFIDGTSNQTTTLRRHHDRPSSPMSESRQLMQAVVDRSNQLRQLLYRQDGNASNPPSS
uniref:ARAD1D20746p n=1 Tax=Blastobotrys adeninivorans TaxID=409370 RepID=A0A060TAM2_BLAAD